MTECYGGIEVASIEYRGDGKNGQRRLETVLLSAGYDFLRIVAKNSKQGAIMRASS